MVKDFLISFSDNFKEKTKNPFLGTYLVVWLFRNWELVYTLFNFDSNFKLSDKVSFIDNYYKKHDFIYNLINNIYWSFALLIATYALLNVSRLIVNFSEKRLTPWIYKLTDSKSIVLKSEYERIRSENDDLQIRLEKEREAKLRLETRIKSLENEIIEASKNNTDASKIDEKDDIAILIEKIKGRKLLRNFMDITRDINQGYSIPNDQMGLNFFIELGLLQYDGFSGTNSKTYSLTDDGKAVLKKARLE